MNNGNGKSIDRVVYRGNNLNNGANVGLGNVNVNNGLTNSNTNIGARLSAIRAKMKFSFSSPLGEWSRAHVGLSSTVEKVGLDIAEGAMA